MFCKYCGSKLEEGSFHCAQCGRSSDKLPCVNCGCELDAGAERCPRCYKRQPKTPCNKCGNKLDADMAFCPLCGERRLRRVRGSDSKLPIIAALTALAVVLTVTIVEFIPRDQEAVTVSGPAAGPLATPGRTDDPAQNEDEYESGGEDDPENTPRESNEKIEERTDDPAPSASAYFHTSVKIPPVLENAGLGISGGGESLTQRDVDEMAEFAERLKNRKKHKRG